MDERLAEIEKQKQNAINQSNDYYNSMLQNNNDLYNQQMNYAGEYERQQNAALDKQMQYNEQLINQQKDVARQNMEIESNKAKNDYFSYINPYGVQAESMASQGLLNSGVSETAKLGGYNTYQNRLATANKVMQDAFVQYDNELNQARLNNDVQKAQNALKKLEMQVQFASDYYNNQNNISQNRLTNNQNLDSEYYNRYNTEYNNYQNELARQEAIRQWQAEFDYQKQQDALAQQNWLKEYNLAKSNSGGSSSLTDGTSNINNSTIDSNNIATDWWNGPINPDTKNGTFATKDKNGVEYQPDNVGGSKLKSSGKTVKELIGEGIIAGGTGANVDSQKVWTTNGKYYVWDGSQNKYIDVSSLIFQNESLNQKSNKKGSSFWQNFKNVATGKSF